MVIIKKSAHEFAINMLSDIVVTICEREEQFPIILLANFLDHYRAHIALSTVATQLGNNVIDFGVFITDQALIDAATAYIAQEANETIAPLKAL